MTARTLAALCLAVFVPGTSVLAAPFALVRSASGTDVRTAGWLDGRLLVARNGEAIDVLDPATGAVTLSFLRPAAVPSLGRSAVRVGSELWAGAPTADAGFGRVVVFDATTGAFLRTIPLDPQWDSDRGLGATLAATATRVLAGAPSSEGGDGAVHLYDAATGALLNRVYRGCCDFGHTIVASPHGFFVARDEPGEVVQLDDDGAVVRAFSSPTSSFEDRFGAGLAVVGDTLLVGAPNAEVGEGRVYRFDLATGAYAGEIASPDTDGILFGEALGAGSGGRVFVGQPALSGSPGLGVGVVHVVQAATGALVQTISNPTPHPDSEGFARSIVSQVPYVAIGNPEDGPAETGVYLYADLPSCGDGAPQAGEACDDGDAESGDGCDANCTPTGCGNAVTTAGETCDDGNRTAGDACGPTCGAAASFCGDGVVASDEECDDGNEVDGDGCDTNCTPTDCGNGIHTAGEDCDDGNANDGDACPNDCNRVFCGDGNREASEECDDGNRVDGDGCSPFCTFAPIGRYGVAHTDVSYTYFSVPFAAERTLDVRIYYPTLEGGALEPGTDGPADAPVAPGRFPLIVDSHGFTESPSITHNPRDHFLARNGFIVAEPTHPGDSLFVFGQVLQARPQDVRFLLDRLLDPATQPKVLRNHVDADRIGAMGQSLGGITATAATVEGFRGSVRDPRVKAVFGTAAENYTFSAADLGTSRVPIMLVIGTRDGFFPGGMPMIRAMYANHQAPRFLVEIVDGDHGVGYWAGTCSMPFCHRAAAARYMLAFFETYLKNDFTHAGILEPGAEAEFGAVNYLADPGPRLVLGGASRDECMVALAPSDGDGLDDGPPRQLVCTDGAACDADPAPGRCGFDLGVCVNLVDRRTARCVPSDVAAIAVKNPTDDAELAALQTVASAIGATSHRRCAASSRLTVKIPARRRSAHRRVRLNATDAAGRTDRDVFVLRCLKP